MEAAAQTRTKAIPVALAHLLPRRHRNHQAPRNRQKKNAIGALVISNGTRPKQLASNNDDNLGIRDGKQWCSTMVAIDLQFRSQVLHDNIKDNHLPNWRKDVRASWIH
jgi:hypothetical protein